MYLRRKVEERTLCHLSVLDFSGERRGLKKRRYESKGQNNKYTTLRDVVTMQIWTAVSPQKKNYNWLPVLREEVDIVVASLKKGESVGVYVILAELLHNIY